MKQDMTVGTPVGIILRFSIPILLGNLFQNFYSMVDSVIVGRLLGTNALAAVGITGPVNFLVMGFILGLTSGYAVITAQAFGSKDAEYLKRSIAMNIMLNTFSAVLFTVLSLSCSRLIFKLINTPDEIIDLTLDYMNIIFAGISATLLYNTCSCILRAIGDSRTPLYFLIFSSVLNIVLDYVLIKYTAMGVKGAALATVFSQALSGVLCLIVIIAKYKELRVSRKHFRWNTGFAAQHLRIALPMAFQFSITAIGVIVLQGALNMFGPASIAGQAAGAKVEQLISVAAGSFGVVMANYVGQNYGAKRIDRVKSGVWAGTALTLAFSLVAMAIALIFPDQLTGLFMDAGAENNEAVLSASRQYLHTVGVFFPALFIIFIYRNTLQSIGKTFWPLMAGVFELVARSICAFTLPIWFGYTGICFAGPIAWFSAAIPLGIAYFVIIPKVKTPSSETLPLF